MNYCQNVCDYYFYLLKYIILLYYQKSQKFLILYLYLSPI